MKRLLPLLLWVLPLLAAAQRAAPVLPTVTVPAELAFAGLRLRLTEAGRAAVQQKVNALRLHPSSFQVRVALADAAFPLIDRVLQEEGVPTDFRYLCLQESGLQGDAQSIHDAVGYWQFKLESATDFGLLVNEQVDERKHLVTATRGAAKYLQRSQRMYQNWLNSLLSYNLGPGGVKPYTLPTDANATEMEVTDKTHPYVLTFLAHKLAYEPAVGANPRPAMRLREYPAVPGQSLAVLAQALQTEPAEMAKYNRWLLGPAVPTDKTYTALVPVTDSLQLLAMAVQQKQNATKLVIKPDTDPHNAAFVTVNGLRAVVALPNESKEELARRAGVKLRRFMQYNDLMPFDNIVVGQPYFVQKKRDKAETEYHVAQTGESLASVSQKYGVRAKAIRSKNRMAANEALLPGRVLWLQHSRPREVAVEFKNADLNAAALERPVGQPAPAEPAAKPVPATPKRKAPEADVYTGRTAEAQRVIDDAPEASEDSTGGKGLLGRLRRRPASADTTADSSVENLNDVSAEAAAPAAQPPVAPARGVYTGGTAKKPLPASSPIADEPQPDTDAVATESAPVKPSPSKAEAAPKPATAPAVTAAPAVVKAAPQASAAAASTAKPVAARPAVVPPGLPASATATATVPVPADGLHTVQPGETLYGVARRYALAPADLVAWNNLPRNPALRPGQVLRLTSNSAAKAIAETVATPAATPAKPAAPAATPKPAPAEPAPAATAGGVVKHTVAAGESMYAISRKYGVTIKQIMEWNNKPDFNVRPGEVLTLKPAK
ncbi:LysM peptidoglycan-binding domain-containing protein [Hymenobacter busanensis]|uniref:LysM peptidoglycan-binding domain-containing protein n=1 Tax=Hymenobacter busanensis TaxID=2607656 RepID=A0A7L5A0X5_9BACT|nr:lytic transglycosylase domain-containing protein [Hymenobacter busanensis]KAA9338405.1 LysM peptidoglycan-binding domain-containing protein [Hymenobacter busanensis]QHJ09168.1 LysM peptidoglycan-binding domain-containing protein [Hymenobacter busanensis]